MACTCSAGKDLHLSSAGADTNPGTREQPWRTLDKASAHQFQPGDRLLLEGGAVFRGTLKLGPEDSGTASRKVTVDSFGSGRATLDGGNGRAVSIEGGNFIDVRNLKLTGSGRKMGNTDSGLYLASSTGATVDHIEVSGFRKSGVQVSGAIDARITFVHAHNNGFAGISSGGDVSRNLYIADCLTENNPGDPTVKQNHSGNGIVVGNSVGAMIERCEARYNGWDMVWNGNGPVGIWAYQSDRVVIQFCVSHHNRSTGADGGGFDLDGGMTNSIVQYNYSHDNYGSGYLICQYSDAGPFENNTVRYNISQDDGLKDHNAGIFVYVGGKKMRSTLVHNNTVFNNKGSAVAIVFGKQFAGEKVQFDFYNNIFVSLSDQVRGAAGGRFAGNLYWAMGDREFRVDGFKSLAEWAASTGQEKVEGRVTGRFADPLLVKEGAGFISAPSELPSLREYRLLLNSPAIGGGLDLRKLFGIDPGVRDFYGNPLPPSRAPSVGAHEYR